MRARRSQVRNNDQNKRRIQVGLKGGKNETDPISHLRRRLRATSAFAFVLCSAKAADVWDNGCGMTHEELQQWATMGISQASRLHFLPPQFCLIARATQSDRAANVAASQAHSLDAAPVDGNTFQVLSALCGVIIFNRNTSRSCVQMNRSVITGSISRFGVGAKRAAFYLGRSVRVRLRRLRLSLRMRSLPRHAQRTCRFGGRAVRTRSGHDQSSQQRLGL